MANEPNTPDHRWYERRNNIALSNEDLSRETIFDSGIQKINSWINSQPWGFDYPQLVLDFDDEYFRVDGGDTTFANAITHTRASTATYVDSTGTLQTAAINEPRLGHHVYNGTAWVNEGLLHESEARTNLVANSSLFTDFDASGSGQTITSGATFAGLGASTIELAGDTVANFRFKRDFAPVASTTYTFSLFISGTSGVFRTEIDDRNFSGNRFQVSINVSTGAVSHAVLVNAGDGGAILSSAAEPFGAGWRVSLTFTTGSLAATNIVTFFRRGDVGTYVIAGRQYEIAPTVSSHIPTAGTTVTRSADVLTIPAANLPYPEPVVIGPELVTNGTFDTDVTGWLAGSGGVLSVVSGQLNVSTVAPDTFATAYQIITTEVGKVYQLTATKVSQDTFSAFGVSSSTSGARFAEFSQTLVGTATLYFVAQGVETYVQLGVGGSGTTTIYDNISVREINPLALSIQMDGAINFADEGLAAQQTFLRWQLDTNNFISVDLDTDSTATGEINFNQASGGVFDTVVTSGTALAPSIATAFNIASRHGSTFINGALNGTALTADTTPVALANLSASNLNLGFDYMGTIKTLRLWGQDVTNAGISEASS